MTVIVKFCADGIVFAAGNPPLQPTRPTAAIRNRHALTRYRGLFDPWNEIKNAKSRVMVMLVNSSSGRSGDGKVSGMVSATPAVSVTVIVVVADVAPGVTGVGLKVTVEPAGAP